MGEAQRRTQFSRSGIGGGRGGKEGQAEGGMMGQDLSSAGVRVCEG